MYDEQNRNLTGSSMENREGSGELSLGDGRFSSQNTDEHTYVNQQNTSGPAPANGYNAAPQSDSSTGGNASFANGYNALPQNDYRYGQGTWQNPNYGQRAGSYQYSGTYNNNYGNANQDNQDKKKKQGKGGKYFKIAAACVFFGLLFGSCVGLGIYAVDALKTEAGTKSASKPAVESSVRSVGESILNKAGDIINETKDAADEIKEVQSDSVQNTSLNKTQTVTTVVSDVSEMVEAVMPAVVSINSTYTERVSYFGQTFTRDAEDRGSGIIVGENDAELLVVTNYHVIGGSEKLGVVFADGNEAEATVKGMDKEMDLAVLSVPLGNIQPSTLNQIAVATLGDSDALKVGQPAVAIGNALGYGQSVTTGCISALNRELELEDGSVGTFIQTDAAINPGNSGGALLNINGEVIGINSNKIGGSAIEGMGYAIPITAASPIISNLMMKETRNKVAKEEMGFLGISGVSVTNDMAKDYGMPVGLYITQVHEGTPAENAGLKKGDIITVFEGEGISSMEELYMRLEYYAKGETVELTVMKVGDDGYTAADISVTLAVRPEQ